MELQMDINGEDLNIAISGKLNTISAMDLDEKLNALPAQVKNIYFDLDGLYYIASAGLRILYWAQDYTSERNGETKLKNVSPEVLDVLTITGMKEFITIE